MKLSYKRPPCNSLARHTFCYCNLEENFWCIKNTVMSFIWHNFFYVSMIQSLSKCAYSLKIKKYTLKLRNQVISTIYFLCISFFLFLFSFFSLFFPFFFLFFPKYVLCSDFTICLDEHLRTGDIQMQLIPKLLLFRFLVKKKPNKKGKIDKSLSSVQTVCLISSTVMWRIDKKVGIMHTLVN